MSSTEHPAPTGLARVEAQFDLTSASWLKRAVGGAIMRSLGAASVPRPQARDEETGRLITSSLKVDGGYRINYFEGGDRRGRQVVFIHGTPGSGRGWVDYLLDVPADHHYIALDRPGFGASGPATAVTSLPEQAQAVAAVARTQNAGPAILVGHSYGAPVAVEAAVDAPDAVAALVLLAGSLDPLQERVPMVQHLGDMWPLASALPRALRNANRELIGLKLELERLEQRLLHVTVPVVIVHGTADKLVPFSNVDFLKSRLTGAASLEIVELTDEDHFLPWSAKAEVDAAIAKAAARSNQPAVRNSDA